MTNNANRLKEIELRYQKKDFTVPVKHCVMFNTDKKWNTWKN